MSATAASLSSAPPVRDPVSVWSKVKFLCLHLFCAVCVDAVPRLRDFLTGRGWRAEATRVYGSPQAKSFFKLDRVDRVPYTAPRYSGHVSTILCAFRPHRRIPYERVIHPGGDGNPIAVDWYPAADKANAKGLFVIVPGLASWSGTNYIEHFVWFAHARGFHCSVFNSRGMGDTPIEKPRLMSGKWTADFRAVLHDGPLSPAAIEARCGKGLPIIGIGFSLGGLILCNYAGEECVAERPLGMDAIFIVNSPLDCIDSSERMGRGIARFLYQPNMIGGLKAYARRHAKVLQHLPGLAPDVQAAFASGRHEDVLGQMKTVRDFDVKITSPTLGYPTPEAYYHDISPLRWLPRFTIPVLCISAVDDPVCGPPPINALQELMAANTNIAMLTIPRGGHLGYVRNPLEEWEGLECFSETIICDIVAHLSVKR